MDVDGNQAVGGGGTQTPPAGTSSSSQPDSKRVGHAGGGRCFYTRLPTRLVKQPGLSAAELTARNLDKSPVLLDAVEAWWGGRFLPSTAGGVGPLAGLLGELQFAFVAFVYGQSLDGFSQVNHVSLIS